MTQGLLNLHHHLFNEMKRRLKSKQNNYIDSSCIDMQPISNEHEESNCSKTTTFDKTSTKSKDNKNSSKKNKNFKQKATIWTIKITITTLVLAAAFSFVSEYTRTANISLSVILLVLLIFVAILSDMVGVATTSCDLEPINSLASRKIHGAKQAILLIKNAEKVSSICCDVIGDICGIVSGACVINIVLNVSSKLNASPILSFWLSIIFASVLAAITVGFKSLFKIIAIKKSKTIVINTAKILAIAWHPKDNKKNK